ncbi:peptidoglycan recognition protein 3 isoform X2 [Erinaceus europaeus]|uniref:Peptidoglycan recognition protein 3 isoform X2 n=1 Tax=Erinaceus europaeus TaxID=9365 RepID=A0ABM3Y7A3_ERIEU|nr:peptidoglycan recognition protein 3 isoform X2 [Erinaceus europaeus]
MLPTCILGPVKMLLWFLVLSALALEADAVPTFVSRKEWGARPQTCSPPLAAPVPYLIMDQVLGVECGEQSICSERLRDLQSHSIYTKHWCDMAYNFLVGDDGRVYEGVGWDVQGVHTQGYNNVSLGLAFFGNKLGSDPSPAALSAAEDLIFYAIQRGHLSPKYIQPLILNEEVCIAPHLSEMPRKACPSIITRSTWEARETHCPTMKTPAQYVIIIHTVGTHCYVSMDCQLFLVGEDGGIYEGVGWNSQGSHTYGFNDIALGIAFMGNFMENPPNAAALEAAQNLIQCAVDQGHLVPDYLLVGHRDVIDTLSPGQALYDIIKMWPHYQP